MPLNPSIPLSAIGRQQPIDIVTPYVRGLQAKGLMQRQRLGELDLEEATRQQTEQRQLKEVFGRHAEAGTVGSQAYLREIGQISPTMFQTERKAQMERQKAAVALEKSLMDLQKADLDLQSSRLQQAQEVNDFLASTIGTTTDQASYERNKAAVRQYFENTGLDTTQIDQLPDLYDPQLLNEYRMQALSVQEQLDEAYRATEIQREQAKQQALQAGRVEEARLKAEATEPSRTRIAEATGRMAAERQAAGQERAAEITATRQPIEVGQRLRLNLLANATDVTEALLTEFTPEERARFVGLGGLRMTVRKAEQLLADATQGKADPKFARFSVLNAMAKAEAFSTGGKQLTPFEASVVFGYVPTGQELSATEYEEKLRLSNERTKGLFDREIGMATTPRSELRTIFEKSTIAAPRSRKVMTETDVQDAMRQTGWTRQEVLDAARQRGYQTPEQ